MRNMKYSKSILITDLDDTVWDWLSIWHTSFSKLYAALLAGSEMNHFELTLAIRKIHQEVGTSEYYFLPQHLEQVLGRPTDRVSITSRYGDIESLLVDGQRTGTKLEPGVFETLTTIKEKGTRIIAYTESMAFGAVERMKATGLDGVIEALYSREDHHIPNSVDLENIRSNSKDYYELRQTRHVRLKKHQMKPNPEVLLEIISEIGANPNDCVYIGDKLLKDVKMAQDSSVLDVHAVYGDNQNSDMYDLLKSVTHWTQSEVDSEAEITAHVIQPTITLHKQFSEILEHVNFVPF